MLTLRRSVREAISDGGEGEREKVLHEEGDLRSLAAPVDSLEEDEGSSSRRGRGGGDAGGGDHGSGSEWFRIKSKRQVALLQGFCSLQYLHTYLPSLP